MGFGKRFSLCDINEPPVLSSDKHLKQCNAVQQAQEETHGALFISGCAMEKLEGSNDLHGFDVGVVFAFSERLSKYGLLLHQAPCPGSFFLTALNLVLFSACPLSFTDMSVLRPIPNGYFTRGRVRLSRVKASMVTNLKRTGVLLDVAEAFV